MVTRAAKRVLGPTRQQELLQYLRAFGVGQVAELSTMLGASASTIRRDLDELQHQGLVERVHGGATITEIGGEPAAPIRATTHAAEKLRIGERGAGLVNEGDTILVTPGTTTEAMLGFLSPMGRVTVVTNGVNIAAQLAQSPTVEVVVLGGLLRRDEMSLLGHLTIQSLADFQIDKVFTSAYGLDSEHGLSGMNLVETQTDRALIASASTLVVLADGSKLSQRGPVKLAPIKAVSTLVTDGSADPTALARIRNQGVEVIVC
jgi:DeoR/GlpR family transcriptional regulator of sugar metabolism